MKIAAPVIVLFTTMAAALNIGPLLASSKPLLSKAKCAGPCVLSIADKIPCGGGPITTLCSNLDKIKTDAEPCFKKCGIDKAESGE